MTDDVQRSLGRIEGKQEAILEQLKALTDRFGDHMNDDQRNFSSLRKLLYEKLAEQDETREKHLASQDKILADIQTDANKAKGAGWVILGLLGGLASLVGSAVLAVIKGWIAFKFH